MVDHFGYCVRDLLDLIPLLIFDIVSSLNAKIYEVMIGIGARHLSNLDLFGSFTSVNLIRVVVVVKTLVVQGRNPRFKLVLDKQFELGALLHRTIPFEVSGFELLILILADFELNGVISRSESLDIILHIFVLKDFIDVVEVNQRK